MTPVLKESMFKYRPSSWLVGGVGGKKDTVEGILGPEYPTDISMYEILLEYFPQLKNDSSTWNLISKSNTLFNGQQNFIKYYEVFKQVTAYLRISLKLSPNVNDSVDRFLTHEEKSRFLEKLKGLVKDDNAFASFSKIADFIKYAEDRVYSQSKEENTNNGNDPTPEEIRDQKLKDLIIQMGVAVASKQNQHELKRYMVFVYATEWGNIIRAKENIDEEEMRRYRFVSQVLLSQKRFDRYENFIANISENAHKENDKYSRKTSLAATREDVVRGRLANGEIDYTYVPPIVFDKLIWGIEEFAKPQILGTGIMDTNYHEAPETNQKVVVVSYGRLYYKKGFAENGLIAPEIIGVTRIGEGQMKNYFVVAPLEQGILKTDSTLESGDRIVSGFVDSTTNQQIYTVIPEKMPIKNMGPMVDLLFSDWYLQQAIDKNDYYVGTISLPNKKGLYQISTHDFAGFDRAILAEAKEIPGNVMMSIDGKCVTNQLTLSEYFGLSLLETKQYKIVQELLDKLQNKKVKNDESREDAH